jgi:hypothetical protein
MLVTLDLALLIPVQPLIDRKLAHMAVAACADQPERAQVNAVELADSILLVLGQV